MSVSTTVRVRKCRFERNTECKSETLGFVGLYWVELSVYIIPPIIYNLLPPWTYPVLGNHVNLLVLCFICVCFRSSMHNKLQLFFSYIIQVGEHVRLAPLVMLKLRENIYN